MSAVAMKDATETERTLYPGMADIPLGVPVRVTDPHGDPALLADVDAAFVFIAAHQPQSVSWALVHGGWRCEAADTAQA